MAEESDLQCSVCFSFFFDPVTIPCGHSFCRACIQLVSTKHNCCPMCRAEFPPGFSPKDLKENFALTNKIKKAFPAEYKEREDEAFAALLKKFELEDQEAAANAPPPPVPAPPAAPAPTPAAIYSSVPSPNRFPSAPSPSRTLFPQPPIQVAPVVVAPVVYQVHPHPLSKTLRDFVCNRCRRPSSSLSSSFYCGICDYDECVSCYSRYRVKHPHRLEFLPRFFTCDICKVNTDGFAFTCRLCNYDECPGCYLSMHHSPKHRHALRLTTRQNYNCDSCSKRSLSGKSFYCSPCDYDECPDCFLRNSQTLAGSVSLPSPAPPPPPVVVRPIIPVAPVIPVVPVTSGGLWSPRHPHLLQRTSRTYFCDVCKLKKNYQTAFTCPLCDYDECPSCFNTAARQNPPCGACGRTLNPVNAPYHPRPFSCNVCGTVVYGISYHCPIDHYDICTSCTSLM